MSSDFVVPIPAPLVGNRDEGWRFDLLDTADAVVGVLTEVTGGQVEGSTFADIKTRGYLTMEGPEVLTVDWTRSRVRVWYTPDGWVTSWPMITGIPATPRMEWEDGNPAAQVDLYDKLLIPRSTKCTSTYTADAGADPVVAAVAALAEIGQAAVTFESSGSTLRVPMVWDVNTPYLRIINQLLAAANFLSLSTNGMGRYRMAPYQSPQTRGVSYTSRSGLTSVHTSQIGAEWDASEIPNRWTSVSTSDGDTDALISVPATDEDPVSPFSFASRGFWVDDGDTDVATTSQAALDAHAARRLTDSQSVYGKYTFEVAPLPPEQVDLGRVLRVVDASAGLDVRGVVHSYTARIEGDPLVSVQVREVTG